MEKCDLLVSSGEGVSIRNAPGRHKPEDRDGTKRGGIEESTRLLGKLKSFFAS
jgi:hypothetical protein